jgi:hypothetical protein
VESASSFVISLNIFTLDNVTYWKTIIFINFYSGRGATERKKNPVLSIYKAQSYRSYRLGCHMPTFPGSCLTITDRFRKLMLFKHSSIYTTIGKHC